MLLSDLLSDLTVKGLPIVGAASGGVLAARKGGPWWRALAYVAGGWAGGWAASRGIQWIFDRSLPQLPAENTGLVQGGTGYDGEAAGAPTSAAGTPGVSGIRYVNLEAEKARAREEAIQKRRERRGKKVTVEGGQVVPIRPSETGSEGQETGPGTALAVVPLAVKRGMMYSCVRLGKNVLGVSRQGSSGAGSEK